MGLSKEHVYEGQENDHFGSARWPLRFSSNVSLAGQFPLKNVFVNCEFRITALVILKFIPEPILVESIKIGRREKCQVVQPVGDGSGTANVRSSLSPFEGIENAEGQPSDGPNLKHRMIQQIPIGLLSLLIHLIQAPRCENLWASKQAYSAHALVNSFQNTGETSCG